MKLPEEEAGKSEDTKMVCLVSEGRPLVLEPPHKPEEPEELGHMDSDVPLLASALGSVDLAEVPKAGLLTPRPNCSTLSCFGPGFPTPLPLSLPPFPELLRLLYPICGLCPPSMASTGPQVEDDGGAAAAAEPAPGGHNRRVRFQLELEFRAQVDTMAPSAGAAGPSELNEEVPGHDLDHRPSYEPAEVDVRRAQASLEAWQAAQQEELEPLQWADQEVDGMPLRQPPHSGPAPLDFQQSDDEEGWMFLLFGVQAGTGECKTGGGGGGGGGLATV
jgi:hypothetical protein